MNAIQKVFLSIVAALLVVVLGGCGQLTPSTPRAIEVPTTIPPGHRAPTREWLADYYNVHLPLKDDLDNGTGFQPKWTPKMKRDLLSGVDARLMTQMDGKNFYFDETTRTWAPRVPPAKGAAESVPPTAK